MSENEKQPEILVNSDQAAPDPTVVIDEANRTVILTEEETIIIDKPTHVEVMPTNRPRKVYGGMWGPLELGVFGASLLALLGLLAFYLFVISPSNTELEQNRAERDRLEQELISARSKYGSITSTETQVAKLVSSVDEFESAYLPIAATGRTALYQRLNGLIAGYGLVNTNGPNYAPLEFNPQQNGNGGDETKESRGRDQFRSIFPGVYVTMTVEGSYQNLRRFIREIETAGEFVIISSVELEPTETKKKEVDNTQPPEQAQTFNQGSASNSLVIRGGVYNNPNIQYPVQQQRPQFQQQQPEAPQGKTHGETVSLRLEMAAYFRRENTAPTVEGN
ncbi:MAG: hypothetical protein ACRD6X_04235 [Pyrinomonadaceae bacterium]